MISHLNEQDLKKLKDKFKDQPTKKVFKKSNLVEAQERLFKVFEDFNLPKARTLSEFMFDEYQKLNKSDRDRLKGNFIEFDWHEAESKKEAPKTEDISIFQPDRTRNR